MDLLGLSPEEFKSFILILVRISVVLFMFPVFSGIMVPPSVKAGLALMVTIVLFPVVQPDPALFPGTLLESVTLILSELVFGLIIGLTVRLFFGAIQLGGQLIGFQMGFAIANVLDPETGTQGSILAQFGYWIAVLLFLILNGHHVLLQTLAGSFSVIRVGSLGLGEGIFESIIDGAGDMFALGVKVGAPAIAALLLTSAAFGIVAKVVPQVNILIVAFPLKIAVGLFFFGVSLQVLLYFMKHYVGGFDGMLTVMMRLMRV
jgi:flagellar biosynthetic protein FliR